MKAQRPVKQEAVATAATPAAPVVRAPSRATAASLVAGARRRSSRLKALVEMITSSTDFADHVGAKCGALSSLAHALPPVPPAPNVLSVSLTQQELADSAEAGYEVEQEELRRKAESDPALKRILEHLAKEEKDGPHLVGAQGVLDALVADAAGRYPLTPTLVQGTGAAPTAGASGSTPARVDKAGGATVEGASVLREAAEKLKEQCLKGAIESERAAGKDVEVVFMLHDIKAAGAHTWASLASAQKDKKRFGTSSSRR